MRKIIFFFLLLSFTFSNAKSFDIPREYEQAVKLAQKATQELKLGNAKSGDSLIKLSIKTYPVLDVYYYALEMLNYNDLNGANVIMLLAIERVKNFPSKALHVRGSQKIELSYKEDAEFNFTSNFYQINVQYGNMEQKKKSAGIFIKVPVINGVFKDYFKSQQFQAEYMLAVDDQNIENGIVALDKIKASKPIYNTMLSALYLECGELGKALESAKEVKGGNPYLFYEIYASMGNSEQASHYIDEIKKIDNNFASNPSAPQPQLDYYTSLLELSRKDYNAAIKILSPYYRSSANQVVLASYPSLYKMCTARGDALTGIKEYEKAKKQYELALLNNPNYTPAKTGLKTLDKIYATDLTNDKIPPVIAITEPSHSRGLEVVSNLTNIMVKGEATDLSGIKEVTINDIKVFAQTSGVFWGDVPMKSGINTITVVAFDMAGNKTEKSFEINKTEPSATTEVVTVVADAEKDGKNYCILIASQNYQDPSIPSLENPISDAIKLKIVLKSNYNFEDKNIIPLFNPTANDIKKQLIQLSSIIEPQDNLLIFYAGHGIWVEKEKKGYWLMTDAVYKDTSTLTPNKEVLDLIAKLSARHTLLITDACFSGSVFKTRGIGGNASSVIKGMDSKITRVAITSGNDTEVPDESVFMKYLVQALKQNKEPYLTAQKMFINQILEAVMTETKTEPRYGTLELAGHVGGDYIFAKK